MTRVGPRIAESIVEFFSIAANRKLVDRLGEAGLAFKGKKKERGTKLAGKTFVLTGTLAKYTRDEAKKIDRRRGRKSHWFSQQETDYVVAGADAGVEAETKRRN